MDTPRRTRMAAADRRTQLIEVARAVVRNEGPEALTMERLSIEANVAKPVVYRHFSDSTEVLLTLVELDWDRLDQKLAAVDPDLPWGDRVRARVGVYFDEAARRGSWLRQLGPTVAFQARKGERRARLVHLFAVDMVAELGTVPIEAEAASAIALAACEGGVQFYLDGGAPRTVIEPLCVDLAIGLATQLRNAE